jgi:hypothetical protein
VDAVCAHPDAVALVGVAAARERAYAPVCVLAVETAIAVKVAAQSQRTDFARASPAAVDVAVAAKQEALGGRSLTAGQVAMITAVCTSGRGVELVLSLLWRADHGQLGLDARSVIVAGEAGLADDPSVLHLLAAAETAGAKVVMVGDHRQLGAVGPAGSLEALVGRHGDGVHILDENVRQVDRDERVALGELRAGNVEAAVGWYSNQYRIAAAPTRQGALDQTVAAWAADVEAGRDTTMLAWRRANVAALNARAGTVMADTGRLTGAELDVDVDGDRLPGRGPDRDPRPGGQRRDRHLPAQCRRQRRRERLQRPGVHGRRARTPPRTRRHRSGPSRPRLRHHRAPQPGSTVDTAHVFADGGGRELGYVAMSRARQASHVHVVADNPGQAVEDLIRDWTVERRQTWAIDTGRPDPDPRGPLAVEADPAAPANLRATLGRGRLRADRDALLPTLRPEPPAEPQVALRQLKDLDGRIRRLNRRLEPQPAQRPVGHASGAEAPQPATERGVAPGI